MNDSEHKQEVGRWGGAGPSDGGDAGVLTLLTVQPLGRGAAQQLLPEVLAEVLAHQVQSKRVHAGVGEGQDASAHAGDEVSDRGVHLVVVEGAVQVDHVTGQPADRKQANEHQHRFSQTLPGLDLRGEESRKVEFIPPGGGGNRGNRGNPEGNRLSRELLEGGLMTSLLRPVCGGAAVLQRGGPRSS